MDTDQVDIARLIFTGSVRQCIEFEASDPESAWMQGNDGVDPLNVVWVEVKEKPDLQEQLSL